ncbi:MAG: DNA primase [Clostridia bacterium]|nr:DNA primase [Clostridia bacterium]
MALNSLITAADQIRDRCNIVDVVSPLVPLKRSGSNYKGCCPFHKEKTPSFVVSEKKQIFTCFGCGKSGSVIKFVQEYYNLSFAEAVRKLAAQYGVEIDDAYERNSKRREGYYEINRQAARFFFGELTTKPNPGYAYLKSRGLTPQTIAKFGLGYADDAWESLSQHLQKAGCPEDQVLELGLCRKSAKNDQLYDKFRSRVMYPIFNTMGKIVGFGGRTIVDDDAKYINSDESFIFEKKRNLYGINFTKDEIQARGYAFVVEGYMDVIGLYQGGVRNVCAALGTALTPEQAALLKRYTKKAVLCLDSDEAGIKAALRGCDVLREAGLDVRVMHVDDGKDPDEYIKKHGADEFRALMEKTSVTDIDFKINLLQERFDLSDITQRVHFLREAAAVLRPLSPVEADLYTQRVAKAAGVSEGALRREIEHPDKNDEAARQAAREQASREREAREQAEPKEDLRIPPGRVSLERMLIKLCMQKSDFLPQILSYDEAFCTDEGFLISEVLSGLYKEHAEFDAATVREKLSGSALAYFNDILDTVLTGKEEEAMDDCIAQLERQHAAARIRQIMDILSIAEEEDDEKLNALMLELTELRRKFI